MTLTSMTAFVLQQSENYPQSSRSFDKAIEILETVESYAKFLSRPLELWMFVPVDQNGKILSEPQMVEKRLGFDEVEIDYNYAEVVLYKQAKERVLFEGFEVKSETPDSWIFAINGKFPRIIYKKGNIEFLRFFKPEITLTPTAIKEIEG